MLISGQRPYLLTLGIKQRCLSS